MFKDNYAITTEESQRIFCCEIEHHESLSAERVSVWVSHQIVERPAVAFYGDA